MLPWFSCGRATLGLLFLTFTAGSPAFAVEDVADPYRDPTSQVIRSLISAHPSADPRDLMRLRGSAMPTLSRTDGDEFWGGEFGLPIANGVVVSAVVFQGSLIIGGNFTAIGGRAISHIARWDGTEWVSAGGGVDGGVAAFLIDGDRLLVGGHFRVAGGQPATAVAAWDGVAWSSIGPSFPVSEEDNYLVRTMIRYQGDLIVGGLFQSRLEPAIQGIARLEGANWHAVGGGVQGDVHAMAVYHDSLCVAGQFYTAGGVPAAVIARWDGTTWSALGDGPGAGSAFALAVYQDRLYVGGSLRRADTYYPLGLASWNGTQWETSVLPQYLDVASLLVHEGKLVIGHHSGADTWDGETVEPGPFFFGYTYGMASDGTDLILVGWYSNLEPQPLFHVSRWDGTRLTGFDTWRPGMHGLVNFIGGSPSVPHLASYGGKLLALESYPEDIEYFGDESKWGEAGAIPTWNGSTWVDFDLPLGAYLGVPTLALASGDRLYFGGPFLESGPLYRVHPVLVFDGISWSGLDTLNASASSMALAGGTLYIATAPGGSLDVPATQHIYRWTAGHWQEIATVQGSGAMPGNTPISGLTEFHGELVAYGGFQEIAGIPANGAASWDGNHWRSLGGGPRDCLYGFASRSAASGERLILQTYPCTCCSFTGTLEAWNGDTWETLPGLRGRVTAMATVRGVLYVSGSLTLEESGDEVAVAAWDGERWSTLGSGLNAGALSIVEHNSALYFGGQFGMAGGKPSFGIARWNGMVPIAPPRSPRLSPGRPNPFLTTVDLSFLLSRTEMVRAAVYDVQGREIVVLIDGERAPGTHPIRWDGRDRAGRSMPAGIYFISLRTTRGNSASTKLVRLE